MLLIIRLNCISCGHYINLHEDVYAEYEGLIKCEACSALLKIKVHEGALKTMAIERILKPVPIESGPAEHEKSFVTRRTHLKSQRDESPQG